MAQIELIVAVAENGVIGHQGDMPWRLPSDLKHFKQVTMGLPVIMGRRTWQSIGRALPGRANIVISGSLADVPQGVVQVATPDAALEAASGVSSGADGNGRVMIIGGGEIYRIFEPQAQYVHLTEVHATPEGDTFFKLAAPDAWRETARTRHRAGEKDSADFSFVTLERV